MKRILLKFLSKHILVMKFGQFMLYYKSKIFINFFWKLWPENEFQALLNFQKMLCKKGSEKLRILILTNFDSFAISASSNHMVPSAMNNKFEKC